MMGKDNQVSVMIRCQWRSGDVTQLFYVCVSFCSLNFKWDFSPGYGLSPPVGTQVWPRWKNISGLGFFLYFVFWATLTTKRGKRNSASFFSDPFLNHRNGDREATLASCFPLPILYYFLPADYIFSDSWNTFPCLGYSPLFHPLFPLPLLLLPFFFLPFFFFLRRGSKCRWVLIPLF